MGSSVDAIVDELIFVMGDMGLANGLSPVELQLMAHLVQEVKLVGSPMEGDGGFPKRYRWERGLRLSIDEGFALRKLWSRGLVTENESRRQLKSGALIVDGERVFALKADLAKSLVRRLEEVMMCEDLDRSLELSQGD